MIKLVNRYAYAGGSTNNRTPYQWSGALSIVALVVLGTHSPIFALGAMGIAAMQIVFGEEDFSWKLIFFLFSFANIFKLAPGSTSLFTYLILLFDVMLFIRHRTLPPLWIFFAIYTVAVPFISMDASNFNLLRWIKLLCSLLMMCYFFEWEQKGNEDEIFIYFIVGVILASLTYYLNSGFFRITRYVLSDNTVTYRGVSEAERVMMRFSGLYSDPNYYSVNVIISMCLVVILFHRDRISMPVSGLLIAVLLYFVKETYSKSSLLMMVLPICMFLYSNQIKRKGGLQAAAIVGIVAVIVYLLATGGGSMFSVVFSRLSSAEGDLNSLTTGRFNIWMNNIAYFAEHPGALLWGQGINAKLLNGRAHHNVYLEMLWHLGVVGGCMFFSLLRQILNSTSHRKKRNPLNGSILCCIVVMYSFLSVLFYFDPPYHIMIAFTVLNMDLSYHEALQGNHRELGSEKTDKGRENDENAEICKSSAV